MQQPESLRRAYLAAPGRSSLVIMAASMRRSSHNEVRLGIPHCSDLSFNIATTAGFYSQLAGVLASIHRVNRFALGRVDAKGAL